MNANELYSLFILYVGKHRKSSSELSIGNVFLLACRYACVHIINYHNERRLYV